MHRGGIFSRPYIRSGNVFVRLPESTTVAAVGAASSSKIALVFADDNGASSMDLVNSLAPNQDALIEAVPKANPNTVVALSTGDPVLAPWLISRRSIRYSRSATACLTRTRRPIYLG